MKVSARFFRPLAVALLAVTLRITGATASEANPASAEDESAASFSVGLAVGTPAGLSFAAKVGRSFALQTLLGWDLRSPGGPTATLDALVRFKKVSTFAVSIEPYMGFGVKATFLAGDGRYGDSSSDYGFTVRFPLGLRHPFPPWPIEAFLEITGGLRWYPDVAFDPDAVIGARILF